MHIATVVSLLDIHLLATFLFYLSLPILKLLFLLEKPRHKGIWYHRWDNGYLPER